MSLYNFSFRQVIFQLLPWFMRKKLLLRYMYSAIKPLATLHNDGVTVSTFGQLSPSLYQFQVFIDFFLKFDARTIYLEKYLNIIYDPVDERIKVVNDNIFHVRYMFNKAEEQAPDYWYNKWQAGTAYIASPEDYVYFSSRVYKCTANSTGNQPPNTAFWEDQGDLIHMFNKTDTFTEDCIIEVPAVVTFQPDYTTNKITNEVNRYNAAGRTFLIKVI